MENETTDNLNSGTYEIPTLEPVDISSSAIQNPIKIGCYSGCSTGGCPAC